MNDPNVTWSYKASKLVVNIKQENLESGVYTLRAQGIDAMGNNAAKEPYQIDFEVVKESTVTNVLPYPNPFSTKTRFVFTLTGDKVPDEIKIQIMTVAGKVVREITDAELGHVRVGHNMSEYAWDGTDEFGEKLGNGVYLYKVIMKKDGKIIDHRSNSTDDAFKHGIGKLYIAR
jgi:flagellar hook assembly protein FlgD